MNNLDNAIKMYKDDDYKIHYVYVKGLYCNKCYIKYTNSIDKILKCFDNVISIYTQDYNKVY